MYYCKAHNTSKSRRKSKLMTRLTRSSCFPCTFTKTCNINKSCRAARVTDPLLPERFFLSPHRYPDQPSGRVAPVPAIPLCISHIEMQGISCHRPLAGQYTYHTRQRHGNEFSVDWESERLISLQTNDIRRVKEGGLPDGKWGKDYSFSIIKRPHLPNA